MRLRHATEAYEAAFQLSSLTSQNPESNLQHQPSINYYVEPSATNLSHRLYPSILLCDVEVQAKLHDPARKRQFRIRSKYKRHDHHNMELSLHHIFMHVEYPPSQHSSSSSTEDNSNAIPMKNSSTSGISQNYFIDLVSEVLRLSREEREGEEPRFKLTRTERINLTRMKHSEWTLSIGQLWVARIEGIIHLPPITANDLEAMDKSDSIVKAIAIVQVLWLVVQLIVRKIVGLPTSQIEIAALAFSVSSIITYFLYLGHPQGVRSITKIKVRKLPTVGDVRGLLGWSSSYLWTGPRIKDRVDGLGDFVMLPNDACNPPYEHNMLLMLWNLTSGNTEVMSLLLGAILGGTVFGGVHCLAWNFKFPTELELTFWRVASVIIAAMPLLSAPFSLMWMKLNSTWNFSRHDYFRPYLSFILLVFCGFPYIIARLFLIVEIFRSLFYSPPGVFIETWSGSFPHWG